MQTFHVFRVFFCEHLTGFFGKHLMCFSRHVSYANILRVSQKKIFKHFMYSSSHFFYLGYMKSRNEYFLYIFSLWCWEIRPSLISRKRPMCCINGNTDGHINWYTGTHITEVNNTSTCPSYWELGDKYILNGLLNNILHLNIVHCLLNEI